MVGPIREWRAKPLTRRIWSLTLPASEKLSIPGAAHQLVEANRVLLSLYHPRHLDRLPRVGCVHSISAEYQR